MVSERRNAWENLLDMALEVQSQGILSDPITLSQILIWFRISTAQVILALPEAKESLVFTRRSLEEALQRPDVVYQHRPRLLLIKNLIEWIEDGVKSPDSIYQIADETIDALSHGVTSDTVPALMMLLCRCYIELADVQRLNALREMYPDVWTLLHDHSEFSLLERGMEDLNTHRRLSKEWLREAHLCLEQSIGWQESEALSLVALLQYRRIIAQSESDTRSVQEIIRDLG